MADRTDGKPAQAIVGDDEALRSRWSRKIVREIVRPQLAIPTAGVFLPLLEPARDKGAWGGRGSGKVAFLAGALIEDSLANKGLLSASRKFRSPLKDSAKRLIESSSSI